MPTEARTPRDAPTAGRPRRAAPGTKTARDRELALAAERIARRLAKQHPDPKAREAYREDRRPRGGEGRGSRQAVAPRREAGMGRAALAADRAAAPESAGSAARPKPEERGLTSPWRVA